MKTKKTWEDIIFEEAYKKMGEESPEDIAAYLVRWIS